MVMQRYFVQLCFKGTRFHGCQVQPDALSVQEVMEGAFSTVLREKIRVVGAGRTDTGVHASFFILHFESEDEHIDTSRLAQQMNSLLPSDIALQKIWKVRPEMHARFSAVSRTYQYVITPVKDPFVVETAYYYRGPLDVTRMNEAAAILPQYNDFTSFSRSHTDVKTNLCKIFIASWHREGTNLVFTIQADRFLRNMVRAITGTLLDVGKGKLSAVDFRKIIEVKNRSAAGASVPAHGLFLTDIRYPEEFPE
ncbi:MAG: tRNA pseudouridine(38-40) synthase TruA, partial [Mariniphaga sp.]|nr:tRNA pseudouridine(38-40) synthase TruA [Mariniphaga sp.]